MSGIINLIIIFSILVAGFIFWKLSKMKVRGRCIIPLQWRIIASLAVLLIIPAIIFLGIAIAVVIISVLLIGLILFIIGQFRMRKSY